MAKSRKKTSPLRSAMQDFVTVAFAEDLDQANEYKALLKENDIRAVVKESERTPDVRSFAVMVPEDSLDEAHVIIESQDAYRDFCEYTLDEEQEAFFDDTYEDDEF